MVQSTISWVSMDLTDCLCPLYVHPCPGFDPVKIASKLREIGDDYDENRIQPLIKNLKQAASDQVDYNS